MACSSLVSFMKVVCTCETSEISLIERQVSLLIHSWHSVHHCPLLDLSKALWQQPSAIRYLLPGVSSESSKAVTFEIPILPPQLLPLNQVLISHHLYSRLWTYRLDNRTHSAVLKAWQCWSQCSELGLQCDSIKLYSCSNAGHASEGQVTEKPFISLWHKKIQWNPIKKIMKCFAVCLNINSEHLTVPTYINYETFICWRNWSKRQPATHM